MKPKDYFLLTAIMLDRAKQFYKSRDTEMQREAMGYEDQVTAEIVRVAQLDAEVHKFITDKCPWLAARLKAAEMAKQVELNFG